jgi:hypothetical protein
VCGRVNKTNRPWAFVYFDNKDTPELLSHTFAVVHFDQISKVKPNTSDMYSPQEMMAFFQGAYAYQASGYGFSDLLSGLITFSSIRRMPPDADRKREDELFDCLTDKGAVDIVSDKDPVEDLVLGTQPSATSKTDSSSTLEKDTVEKEDESMEIEQDTSKVSGKKNKINLSKSVHLNSRAGSSDSELKCCCGCGDPISADPKVSWHKCRKCAGRVHAAWCMSEETGVSAKSVLEFKLRLRNSIELVGCWFSVLSV